MTSLMQMTNGVRVIPTLDLIGSAGLVPIILLTVLRKRRALVRSDFVIDG
jgi:hypothetical protein